MVPEPGQPLTKNRFKQIYAKEQKGPITAITQVSGFLVSAVGQKVLPFDSLEWTSGCCIADFTTTSTHRLFNCKIIKV